MKKLLIGMFALILLSGSAFAQKGTWYLGTSGMRFWDGSNANGQFLTGVTIQKSPAVTMEMAGISTIITPATTVTTMGIAPEAGYFFADKWAVGLGLGFGYSINAYTNTTTGDDVKEGTISFGINPYTRYYFWSIGNFSVYAQGGLSYSVSKTEENDAQNIFSIGINPGIAYGFNEHFGINATFGFLGYTYYGEDNSWLGLSLSPNTLTFGVSYVF